MKKQWKGVLLGFAVGILVMFVINRSVNVPDDKPVESTKGQQEEQQQADSMDWEEMHEITNKEVADEETVNEETVDEETVDEEIVNQKIVNQETMDQESDGYYISEHMQIPTNFTEQILLYGYIEYGIRKYNEANQQTTTYSCNIEEDMLPYDTEFCMADTNKKPFKTDLAKEIIPELANNIYNFRLSNQDNTIYMSIDTYNMKTYVYDAIAQ